MAPPPQHDPRRLYKRAAISDQQRRRDSARRAPAASPTPYCLPHPPTNRHPPPRQRPTATSPPSPTYIIDMICWRGYSLYDCTAEFRIFWVNYKLTEISAGDPPSTYHRYRFCVFPMYESTLEGLEAVFSGSTPYAKDGLLFYNKHARYQSGITSLTLVWKDVACSQYVLDTDSEGHVPTEQHVVLELQEDGKLITSDDPPIVFGSLNSEFIQKSNLRQGTFSASV
ncbi:uncharacterized protein LOC124696426 [Lolium rigidum]|uniref:uncharacterized protein LOC124696426 n=1 Tax=Lolium rigidum TaxID=89674 RepID=UPI001F5CC1D6|nr:uncharacterized protein LOC124696426 [Lolium rigidum]